MDGNLAHVWKILDEKSLDGLVCNPTKGKAFVVERMGESNPIIQIEGKVAPGQTGTRDERRIATGWVWRRKDQP